MLLGLGANQSLESLELITCSYFDVATPILLQLLSHPSLRYLWVHANVVTNNDADRPLVAFLKATETLEHIFLDYFELTGGHWDLFIEALQCKPKLSKLSMQGCKLDTDASQGFVVRFHQKQCSRTLSSSAKQGFAKLWFYIWESLGEFETGRFPLSRR
jgi:hypothetical protein